MPKVSVGHPDKVRLRIDCNFETYKALESLLKNPADIETRHEANGVYWCHLNVVAGDIDLKICGPQMPFGDQ